MTDIAISCIIPTIRGGEFLARAVNSILEQDFDGELEVIVVNDAGYETPLTPADWQKDSRVKIITTNKTERCFARNTGACAARGKYLHFLDDDDYILSGAYKVLFARAEETAAVWTYGKERLVDDNQEIMGISPYEFEGDVYALLFAHVFFHLGASLIRRTAFLSIGGFDPKFNPAEDSDLLFRLAFDGNVAYAGKIVMMFRVGHTPNSTTPWSKLETNTILLREKQFALTGCIKRTFESIRGFHKQRGLLCGKLVRYYLGSAVRYIKVAPLRSIGRIAVAIRFFVAGMFRYGFVNGLWGKEL